MKPKSLTSEIEKELNKLADNWVIDGDFKTFTGDDEIIARQNFKDDVGVLISSQLKEVLGVIESKKTDERKVSIFGKGMDSWEARSYDEKMLVNAVLKDIKDEVEKLV